MEQNLCIYACNMLSPELSQQLREGDYPDVSLKGYVSNCSGKCILKDDLLDRMLKDADDFSKIIFIGGACLGSKNFRQELPRNIEVIRLEQCFEVYTNLQIIYHLINQGSYLVTNGWLKQYKQYISEWAFEKDAAKAFFGESLKKVLLLETGLEGSYKHEIEAVAHYMGLPYEIMPIGNDHMKMYIDSIVYKWRIDTERSNLNERIAKITRETADYAVLFSQLKNLINHTDEELLTNEIASLIDLLFMPQEICFVPLKQNKPSDFKCFKQAVDSSLINNENTFTFDIVHKNVVLGKYTVSGILFPQFIKQYKAMADLISQIAGLAFENARKYNELEITQLSLRESEAQLRELNASKDKFFSIIGHDLRSPFNAIIVLSEYLTELIKEKDYEEISQIGDVILQSSKNAMLLLSNLLEWARAQSGRIEFTPENINLGTLSEELIAVLIQVANQKSIKISNEIGNDITIYGDKSMIAAIIRNLISNAVKFTNIDGEIIISAKLLNNECVVSVRDNGIGISQDRIDKLFRIDQSESTAGTAKESGTGLGLILCKEFVEMHKGRIWAESNLNEGTSFFFSIPFI